MNLQNPPDAFMHLKKTLMYGNSKFGFISELVVEAEAKLLLNTGFGSFLVVCT